jgi:hypothetical protein
MPRAAFHSGTSGMNVFLANFSSRASTPSSPKVQSKIKGCYAAAIDLACTEEHRLRKPVMGTVRGCCSRSASSEAEETACRCQWQSKETCSLEGTAEKLTCARVYTPAACPWDVRPSSCFGWIACKTPRMVYVPELIYVTRYHTLKPLRQHFCS